VTRTDAQNGSLLVLALAACITAASSGGARMQIRVEQLAPSVVPIAEVRAPDGSRALRDASGTLAPLRHYARIASTSLVADHVLDALCEPERIVAVSTLSKVSARLGYRYSDRTGLGSPTELEAILAQKPDLLIINHFGDPRFAARLRTHGVVVFDLGEMHGLDTLLPNIRTIGTLIGADERAEALARTFARRMRAVAADVPVERRPRALYLSAYGKQLYGGARGTSYHDVLEHAGLHDLAAERYEGWPAFDPEQVLAFDPDVLVTKRGMARELCAAPGLSALRACRGEARIIELEAELIDDPGLPMLEAAEELRTRVHGTK
jgi:iron complex transport system substrate-binding protein